MILEGFSVHGAMKEIHKIPCGKLFAKWFRETRQSELMVVAGMGCGKLNRHGRLADMRKTNTSSQLGHRHSLALAQFIFSI